MVKTINETMTDAGNERVSHYLVGMITSTLYESNNGSTYESINASVD